MTIVWLACLLVLGLLMRGPAMWRTWAALLCAMAAGHIFPDPVAWALIDLTAAFIVIFPPRIGFQKAIAAMFGAMLFLELGWLISNRLNVEYIVNAGSLFGWLQLAALLTWGLDDRYGARRILDWLFGPSVARARVDAR